MIRSLSVAAIATAAILNTHDANSGESSPAILCPMEEGKLPGPYVPTAQTAREIYQAVARARHVLRSDLQIVVVDESDGWGVLQVVRGTTNDPVGFELEINKCSGQMFARGKISN
jgi:hypothetical protein